jgi:hypothetical protein
MEGRGGGKKRKRKKVTLSEGVCPRTSGLCQLLPQVVLPLPVSCEDDDVEGDVDDRREDVVDERVDGVPLVGQPGQGTDAQLEVEVLLHEDAVSKGRVESFLN